MPSSPPVEDTTTTRTEDDRPRSASASTIASASTSAFTSTSTSTSESTSTYASTSTSTSSSSALNLTSVTVPVLPPATVPQNAIEVDEAFQDEALSENSASSYVSSIASDLRRGIEENGHLYPAFRSTHLAMLPIDESELDRNDFQHLKIKMLQEGRLHLAPIGDQPQKILDLGTGTGIWAIEMADQYPTASIIGIDLAPVQPSWVPPNLQFELDDIEKDWLWPPNSFDLIHARELLYSIRDWPRLVKQAYDHLKPGGYLELSATIPLIESDDNTIPPGSCYKEVVNVGIEIGNVMGVPITSPLLWKDHMRAVGFENIVEEGFKVPTNPWPKDKRLKQIGALEVAHFREGVANLMIRAYTQVLKRDPKQLEVLMTGARREVLNLKMHSYLRYHVAYAKKPGQLDKDI